MRTETIVVKMGRISFDDDQKAEDDPPAAKTSGADNAAVNVSPPAKPRTPSFRIEVSGPAGGKAEDNAWETCTGGAATHEVDRDGGGAVPGRSFIDEVQLRGPMTASRRWVGQSVDGTLSAKSRFDLTIVEIMKDGSDGKRFNYIDCFPTRYVFPRLSAEGTGNLYEEVSLKPIRLELQ